MVILCALLLAAGPADVRALVAELDALAPAAGWPGFDASAVPLVIHDGEATWLLRHPAPPPEFEPVDDGSEATDLVLLWFPGLHASVRANTSTEIAGVTAASLMLDGDEGRAWPALLLHECFHVFQRERHPDWTTNEALLLTYPCGDAELLALRRMETAALREALAAESTPGREAARRACALRAERARRAAEAVAYERGVEVVEGLAQYVERRALGAAEVELPGVEPAAPAAMLRRRAYAVGEAWARLLDRHAAGWKESFGTGDARALDLVLARALGELPAAPAIPPDLLAAARVDVEESAAARERRRGELEGATGLRLVIRAPDGAPLSAGGFDPLNVEVLGGGLVVHERYVSLTTGDGGEVEVLGQVSVTRAAGPHPLFSGIAELVVPGLAAPPEVARDGEATVLRAGGVTARFPRCTVERDGNTTLVTL